MTEPPQERDVVVVGGGQAALATGFYLRRSALSHVLPFPAGWWRKPLTDVRGATIKNSKP